MGRGPGFSWRPSCAVGAWWVPEQPEAQRLPAGVADALWPVARLFGCAVGVARGVACVADGPGAGVVPEADAEGDPEEDAGCTTA